jgi:hypothetical protein
MSIATHIWDDDRLIRLYEALSDNKLPLEDADLLKFS